MQPRGTKNFTPFITALSVSLNVSLSVDILNTPGLLFQAYNKMKTPFLLTFFDTC